MKTVFVCPFDLDRLTGTPIRTKVTVGAVSKVAEVSVIAAGGGMPSVQMHTLGKCSFLNFSRQSLSILRREKPDVIHGVTTIAVLPMLTYKVLHPSVRTIFEMHGWSWFEQQRGSAIVRFALFLLDMIGLWCANAVAVMSETQRDFLCMRTMRPNRIVVIWGPSEFDEPFTDPPGAHTGTDGIVIGYIGNSAWRQGLPAIVGAARRLAGVRGLTFALAGFDASDETQFPRLSNVSYVGRVERVNVLRFLKSCDVLVSSRLPERVSNLQYPQKLSEYLSAGRPVVVSAANDQPRIVEAAQCGLVVDPMTEEVLTAAIQKFAAMPQQQRREWGMRSLAFAKEHFIGAAFNRKIASLYRSI